MQWGLWSWGRMREVGEDIRVFCSVTVVSVRRSTKSTLSLFHRDSWRVTTDSTSVNQKITFSWLISFFIGEIPKQHPLRKQSRGFTFLWENCSYQLQKINFHPKKAGLLKSKSNPLSYTLHLSPQWSCKRMAKWRTERLEEECWWQEDEWMQKEPEKCLRKKQDPFLINIEWGT